MADDDTPEEWATQRLETTYEQVCSVLDAQQDTISDIDTKAMRTVRFTVLLVGVAVTTAKATGPGIFDSFWLGVGVLSLFGSLAVGVLTYSESDLYLGPSEQYVERLVADDFSERPWNRDMLRTCGEWISENHEVVRSNGWLLVVAQAMLLVGVASPLAAVL